ncbi:MAG: hypothetical protein P8Y97_06865 [Candidatus Lokiarchaeota archaeon]
MFNDYIDKHQDFRTQLRGFLIDKIDLTRLTLNEVLEALSLIMIRFWNQAGLIHPSNPIYPFTLDFFSYLYEYHAHEYREILIYLDKVWTRFKQSTQIFEFNNSFDMIKFVRLTLSPSNVQELFYSSLLDWEKEKVKDKFKNIKSRHTGGTQSDLVEKRITNVLRILQENEIPKQISWVEKSPTIKVETEKGKETRYPDIYVQLIRSNLSNKRRTFEIQVKMYDKENYIKLKDIDSSLVLLERAYTDALLFIITGGGLEESVIQEIHKLNLADRILYFKPLNLEQFKALSFIVYYRKITGKEPTVSVIKEVLKILFEEKWDNIIEKIRNIGSFRAKRIIQEIKEKEKSTITGFLEPQTSKESIEDQKIVSQNGGNISAENQRDVKVQNKLIDKQMEVENLNMHKEKVEIEPIDIIIADLKLEEIKNILKILYKRYQDNLKELNFIFHCINSRTDRHKGKATKDYLKKRVPPHLSDELINELFLRLKNEDLKNQVNQEEKLVTYEGSSICITDIGKEFYTLIKKMDKL